MQERDLAAEIQQAEEEPAQLLPSPLSPQTKQMNVNPSLTLPTSSQPGATSVQLGKLQGSN